MTGAYYLPTGEPGRFAATEFTSGPWSEDLSHGGPPSSLITRAVEKTPAPWDATVVRLAMEILGPVPVGEVTVSTEVVRSGRTVELVEAELSAGGRVAIRGRAWRIRRTDVELPDTIADPATPPPIPKADADAPPFPGHFIDSLQLRFTEGSWTEPGPATVWARQRVALVEGEEPTPLQRLMVLADCGNGVSNALPIDRWFFINPDLTVHLSRYPEGDWLCLQAATTADGRGFGLATSTLYDTTGRVAVGAQSLYVAPR